MATMILRETHKALIEEMERLEKLKKRPLKKLEKPRVMEILKKMQNTTLLENNRV